MFSRRLMESDAEYLDVNSGLKSPKLSPLLTEEELFMPCLADSQRNVSLVRVSMRSNVLQKEKRQTNANNPFYQPPKNFDPNTLARHKSQPVAMGEVIPTEVHIATQVVCNEKKIDFGAIPVGQRKIKSISLSNVGENAAVFSIEPLSTLKIYPMKGRILVGSTQKLRLEFRPTNPETIQVDLMIDIRGGERLKIPIVAEAQIPKVEIDSGALNFGEVFIGACSTCPVVLKNKSELIPAILYLDLSQHPDFHVATDSGELVTDTTGDDQPITCDIPAGRNDDEEDESNESCLYGSEGEMEERIRRYRITIEPNSRVSFFFCFQPRSEEAHQFILKFNLEGASSMSEFNREVKARAMKPRLVPSHYVVDFGRRATILEPSRPVLHSKLLTLANEDTEPIEWRKGSIETETAFYLEPASGSLNPGQTIQVQVFFKPKEKKEYSEVVSIYLDEKNDLDIKLKGIGADPAIRFDVLELILPVTPLNIPIVQTFYVINEGYENLDLKYRLPIDTSKVPLKLRFPEGSKLSAHKQKVPVELTFISTKPISFNSKIDFFDHDGNKYSIHVSCTADNCLLTNYPYLVANKETFNLNNQQGEPISLLFDDNRDDREKDDDTMSSTSVYSENTVATGFSTTLPRMFRKKNIDRVLHWLNASVLENPIDDLMKVILLSNGHVVYDIVGYLSGKQLTKRKKRPSNKGETAYQALYSHHEEQLNMLKTYGAFVSTVRAELLLSYDDFLKLTTDPGFPNSYHEPRRMSERTFRYRSAEAWGTVLYQIIKVFLLSTINLKQAKAMSPEIFAGSEIVFPSSNVYSVAENILLRWMTFYVNKQFPSDKGEFRVANFGSDLRNGKVFASLIMNHIPHVNDKLEGFITNISGASDYEHNASLIIEALRAARIDYQLSVDDLLSGSPREMLLFSMFLYQTLPQFIPKTTVEFTGNLLETITKNIEMVNPTKHLVEYHVSLEGSKEFIILDDHLVLKPKAKHILPISIKPRFTAPVEARLTLQAKRSGAYNPTTMVFHLQTKIVANRFQQLVEISNVVYESRTLEVVVENLFENDCEFEVSLQQSIVEGRVPAVTPPDPFFCSTKFMQLKKGEKKTIAVQFLPFISECTYACIILLSDKKVGELMHCIRGRSTLPEPIQQFEIVTESNRIEELIIQPTLTNVAVEKANIHLMERVRKRRVGRTIAPLPEQGSIDFKVQYSSPFFSGPESLTLTKNSSHLPELKVLFSPKIPGVYCCNILLQNELDIRLYTIEGKAMSPGINSVIEFGIPVRQTVTQELPITNHTDTPWTIHASLNGEYFFGANKLSVPPKTCCAYQLSYMPMKMGKHQGTLELLNPNTLEKFVFVLRGNADDPLPEEKIRIDCLAKETMNYFVHPPSLLEMRGSNLWYTVLIEPSFITGSITHVVPFRRSTSPLSVNRNHVGVDNKDSGYQLSICPPVGGAFSGRLLFIAPDDEFVWYEIEVNASRTLPEGQLSIKSVIRESSVFHIPIHNSSECAVDYVVHFSSKYLEGRRLISVQPNETIEYDLCYSPLQPGVTQDSISFYNAEMGEIWYELELVAEIAPPIRVPPFSCPIGQSVSVDVELKNPLNEAIRMLIEIDNPNSFAVSPQTLILTPSQSTRAQLIYHPSSMNTVQKGSIRIYHAALGDWHYICSGVGLAPSQMDVKKVFGQVMRTQSAMISFRNPFPVTKTIAISIEDETRMHFGDNTSVFHLVTSHNKEKTLVPFSSTQIPFIFAPLSLREYRATILVRIVNEDIEWKYPIIGVAEAVTTEIFSFKCKARTIVEKVIQISVTNELEPFDSSSPSMSIRSSLDEANPTRLKPIVQRWNNCTETSLMYEIVVPEDQDNAKAIKRALAVSEVKPEDQMSDKEHFYLKVEFAPLRPLIGTANLLIRQKQGGVFKYELLLEATTPEVDETIEITSIMGCTEKVGFRLSNIFPESTPFEAYFTYTSSHGFSVSPMKGDLPPYGDDGNGTQFVISLATGSYGKAPVGTLVIDTEDMQWRYEVRESCQNTKLSFLEVESTTNP